ncbi:hypothetical protein D7Y13_16020 [Corallococcus praedator]|uniref:Uncharacterized protein n=1 Tax=Corallococcus praedator TaxID=2316724 RepID=A0ABX9QHQ8_9BACT|nr:MULTISPECIES: hypothetical protein [Corallococcus]RKH14461.1 hypothetical protein D7X74_20015 [Corallococcus sp. CA047B]RKH28838.1 hypothetical protein D7X75_23960 [Corallococcus sp. CA031C]RKI08431.1 hypothetical protein D7Y13_16020 [Corallococcus praedator]
MKRLFMSSLAVLAIHVAGCGGGMEEGEVQAPAEPVVNDKTQAGPINGPFYGTHVDHFSDSTMTTRVGVREWGCSSATMLINWGVEGYERSYKFLCAQEF